MSPIRFKEHHREELLKLGLTPQAIEQIEVEGLPPALAILEREPPRAEVRGELQSLSDALTEARTAVERLLNATATPSASE
jgi:hypothetical protein